MAQRFMKTFRRWMEKWWPRAQATRRRLAAPRRLGCEPLEDRQLLTIVGTSVNDTIVLTPSAIPGGTTAAPTI